MSAAIATAIHAELPQAELVHDKFHVSKLLGQAVDKVRQFFLRAYLCFVTSA
jgi:transposase